MITNIVSYKGEVNKKILVMTGILNTKQLNQNQFQLAI